MKIDNIATRALTGLLLMFCVLVTGCTNAPEGVEAVTGFELPRFLGTWYEIARLDHGFERNQRNVTVEYLAGEGDEFKAIDRGFNEKTGQWVEDEAVAKMIGDNAVGSFKESYFGPFWGGKHIIALDRENYRYAMVTGPSKSLLWILARDKTLDDKTLGALIAQAGKLGYNTKKLIFVKHEAPEIKEPLPQPAADKAE